MATTSRRLLKTSLGRFFSEGARQLWLVMIAREWSQTMLGEALDGETSANVNRWLYGERRPQRAATSVIQRVLGIDPTLFDQPPKRAFVVPERLRVSAKEAA